MIRHAAAAGRFARAAVLLLAATPAFAAPPDTAGVVTLKDGHVIRGYVLQPTETIVDPISKDPVTLHKGIFLVDDLCRRYFFSHAYVEKAENRPFDPGKQVVFKRERSFPNGLSLPPIREVIEAGEWSDTWDRNYRYRSPRGVVKMSQHLEILTPYFARVNANAIDPVTRAENNYPWSSFYPTRELGPDLVVSLLSRHPDLKDSPGLTAEQRADRRFQIFNFLVQANWMSAAQKELDGIRHDFPDQKDKIDTAAEGIKRLVALDRWDEIKLAHDAGRHEAAQKLLAAFPAEGADEPTQAEARALKVRYDSAAADLKRAKQLLTELAARLIAGENQPLFREAAAAIAAELTLDHFLKNAGNDESRLDRFLSQAEQAERFAKQDKPHAGPDELLSLAVTAWLLGPASAETKPEAARRVWQARQLVLDYQRTADPAARAALVRAYESKSGLSAAEMAQLIAVLPPPDPPEKTGTDTVEMTTGGAGRGTAYALKLPPEYHTGRPYPVLLALHKTGEGGKEALARWSEYAAKYGYVLAAPEWGQGIGGFYAYTPEEHAVVLDTLRDLRRHFNVDSDRVFLTGYGEGGNMAFDVGLAHPDLFAGVIPVSGQPRFHARNYWTNALDLPFYVVWGEYMGGPNEDKKASGNFVNLTVFKDDWIPGAYPVVGVQYKGRGLEWFPAEVPSAFEWMAHKRRRHPTDRVGKVTNFSAFGGEFRTMRPGDNHFYWLSAAGLSERALNDARAWNPRATPALLAAKVTAGNQIAVYTRGVRQVSVWLAGGMIDFDKPLTVRVNFQVRFNNEKVTPRLTTLLEDFYDRGDRQQLYLARLDLNP